MGQTAAFYIPACDVCTTGYGQFATHLFTPAPVFSRDLKMAQLKMVPTRPATGVYLNWQLNVFIIYLSSFESKKRKIMLINFQEIRA